MVIQAQSVLSGACGGHAVWTDTPLSFWGGVDPESGRVVDRHHPLYGVSITGRVLIVPATRGSSTSSGVLLEMIRRKTAPVGIVTKQLDPVLALAGIIGDKLYQRRMVLVRVEPDAYAQLHSADLIEIRADGTIYGTAIVKGVETDDAGK